MPPLNSDDRRAGQAGAILWLTLALVPAFGLTAVATRAYRTEQQRQARSWFARGEAFLRDGHAVEAIASFHNALAFSREDERFRLRLAQALAAAGRTAEARAYLLTLRNVQPGDGEINLELARLAARDGDVDNAARFYRHAIEGAWNDSGEERRRDVRLELAGFLIARGRQLQARTALIALHGDQPAGTPVERSAAALMLEAGLDAQASAIYEAILRRDPADHEALAGAGRAKFNQGQYTAAVSLLLRATGERGGDPRSAELLATARLIVDADPYQRRLPMSVRAKRTERALESARARLSRCSADRQDPALRQLSAELQTVGGLDAHDFARSPEAIDAAMDLVYRIEQAAAAACGEPDQPLDRALLLLAGRTGGAP